MKETSLACKLLRISIAVLLNAILIPRACTAISATQLPEGVRPVWDLTKAYHDTTATRERVCLNGLWRWQPAAAKPEQVPLGNWGYFKVPGCWPGTSDYMQKDSQTLHVHPAWQEQKLGSLTAAWYERDIAIPPDWAERRIVLRTEYLHSFAEVFLDGKRIGEIHFPGGELDVTGACWPGSTHRLSLLVVAMPLKAVVLSYTDSASAREVKGSVPRRGLCGDVYLISTPKGPRIADLQVDTSVRKKEIGLQLATENLAPQTQYTLHARIMERGRSVKEFTSRLFQLNDLKDGRMALTEQWMPDRLWDTHTPQNKFDLQVSLLDKAGKVLDAAWTTSFGFREFWIDGRDFYLNGTRIFLSSVPFDNAQVSAAAATYDAARESMERLKSFGINYVYTHTYGCEPGSHLGFTEILRAADDAGMLLGFSQPHFSHYDWQASDADRNNGYARHAAFYVQAAQNHPAVVMYSMSHNATGYEEDMNPDLIDGIHDPRNSWAAKNAKLALRAEAIVKRLDPGRIIYHHASGNLGSMHVINFYPNFVPIQELSDWFGHWATQGVKPAFTCEYGAPFSWDWAMYRGWYKGQREFGSAKVPWEFCIAEWNAQFLGDRAFAISEAEKANLRWEARQFRAGNLWKRWDYPQALGSKIFDERYPVFASYLTDNWRAFRTWGVSGISPWEHEHFWKLRDGADKRRRELTVDWENLQRPGFSPDYLDKVYERMDLAYERSDWIATPAAEALIRNNRPLLAYIAGKPASFTSKDHNFLPGEIVEKQIVLINNSREMVTADCDWTFALPEAAKGNKSITVPPGQQQRLPLRFELAATLPPGRYPLTATVKFSNGETQTDTFPIDVLSSPGGRASRRAVTSRIALFDPKGETTTLLKRLGIQSKSVDADANLSSYDILIVGKSALSAGAAAPNIDRVRDGLRVIVFEQTSEVLEKRFGFRVEEYGLRQIFPRVPDHPILAGLAPENLHNWRGEATILPGRLKYELRPRYGPTVQWCDIPVTRIWRCGNRGNVASVLIEKPARGDFLPIADGGYSLQYSPLMEYREGKGVVLFCQLDVTGRTEVEPAAERIVTNLVEYISNWKPAPHRNVLYAGDPAGKKHLESTGIAVGNYDGGKPSGERLLVVGPAAKMPAAQMTSITDWLNAGGNLLALGLDQSDAAALGLTTKRGEHISCFFEPAGASSLLAGIGPADLHNRDPREFPLVMDGAELPGDGILAKAENKNLVLYQMAPWQFDPSKQMNLKRTYRHASFVVSRLLGNMGVAGATPLLERFNRSVSVWRQEKRWLTGLYLDQPEEWDDPYRFFRW